MRVHVVARLMLVALIALFAAAAALAQDAGLLKYDDGTADGVRSTAQAGYITTFSAPDDMPVLKSVSFYASRYGRDEPRDFTVTITDFDLNPVAVFGFPYSLVPYGMEPGWVELQLPQEVRPPKQFAIAVYAHCLEDCGIFMSLDLPGDGKSYSYSTLPGETEAPNPDLEGAVANWMIRCQMAAEAKLPDDRPTQLAFEDGRAVDKQSFGGGAWQAVRFQAPDDATYIVERVLVCGSYYGVPSAGASNVMAVAVGDENGAAFAQKEFRYDEFYWGGTPSWTSLPLDAGVEVKGTFTILTDMRSQATPGIFVGYGVGAEESRALVGRPGQLNPWTPRNADGAAVSNWCIRCELRKKAG
jgi:hypothetical protein